MRFLLLFLTLLPLVLASAQDHRYAEKERVSFLVNKIGPYSNPSETYDFYSLPFCHPPRSVQHRHSSLGEDLEGDSISPSLYDIRFRVDTLWNPLCRVHLNAAEIAQFQDAIERYYYYEWFFDGLPIHGFVGIPDWPIDYDDPQLKVSELPYSGLPDQDVGRTALNLLPPRESQDNKLRHFLFRHIHFTALYNEDRIIAVNISSDIQQVQLIQGTDLTFEFSYSISWHPTTLEFSERMNFIAPDPNHGSELQIRWLGILNSSILVVFLTGFVAVILMRILKSDYSRYRKREINPSQDDDEPDDYGWKLVHGEVFRFPNQPLVFCSLLGVGAQFLVLVLCSLLLSLSGIISPYNPGGSAYTAAILLFSLTCVIAGLVSSYFYTQMDGQKWAWCVVCTSILFAFPFFFLGLFLNLVAVAYDSTSALSLNVILLVVAIWTLIGFPLTLVGSIAGRHLAPPFEAPTRTNFFPRQIPPAPWYRHTIPMMLFSGFLPFSAIYIELYFIYYSVWGHHHYTLFGILFLVFFILLTVTACVTISLTYFQLAMEDHRWWWRAFFNGGSTGLFIYAYSIYYYLYASHMSGFFQACFFFVRMFLASYVFWIMLGSVGVFASLKFIKQIYSNIKFS